MLNFKLDLELLSEFGFNGLSCSRRSALGKTAVLDAVESFVKAFIRELVVCCLLVFHVNLYSGGV